jgi:hypothetical protein
MRSWRRVRSGVALVLLAGLLLVDGLAGGQDVQQPAATPEPALELTADSSQFRPGNIISDSLFFDGFAMSAGDVQGLLNSKGASCVDGAMPCLKNYTQDTWTRAADAYCNGYAGARGETAATIVAKVGQTCGISQRVLLVIMQKEQSLVTGSGTAYRYERAMGYACPDTAPCNAEYFGFYNQVYNSARRFKIYAANSNSYNYKAGRWNTVLYNPDRTCGSSSVFIENQATAGLYTYTPYQPNAAALAAGYGSAPPCGAYGNRNFWLYFTDWFGSTQSPGGTAILARASAPGFDLGPATSSVICGLRDGGCFRNHRNGAVYWSPATGAQIVRGAIGGHWGAVGWEGGRLGYPLREEICGLTDGGCFQEF